MSHMRHQPDIQARYIYIYTFIENSIVDVPNQFNADARCSLRSSALMH
jgi:hypothetical protein